MRIAIIPARGGSKGLPLKNLAEIGGVSLIARCVRTCLNAGLRTFVSTDHDEIERQAKDAGALVVRRPVSLGGDGVTSQDVMRHVLMYVDDVSEVLFAQCTSPMLTVADIRGTLDKLPEHDLVICCVPFDGVVLGEDGIPINQPIDYDQNRQKRSPQYVISGHCWSFRPEYLNQQWMTGNVGIHVAEFPHRVDIDRPCDLSLARRIIEGVGSKTLYKVGQVYFGDAGALV